jgi:hypothetical protein
MTYPRESLVKLNRGLFRYGTSVPTVITGRFTIGAAATFYETQQGGQGCIVARTGAGAYTITLDDLDVGQILSATCCVQDTAGAHTDIYARAEDIAVAAGVGTVDIECYTGAVATDVLTANNLWCHFQIVYTRTGDAEPDDSPIGYYHHSSDPVLIAGRVAIGAAGAPGVITGGGVATVAGGAGTGVYTLTFTDAFNQFLGGTVNAGNATGVGGDLTSNFGAFTAGGAGAATLLIYTTVAAVATDPANGGNINYSLYLGSESSGA